MRSTSTTPSHKKTIETLSGEDSRSKTGGRKFHNIAEDGNVPNVRSGKKPKSYYIPTIRCEICNDLKPHTDFFLLMGGCPHYYCTDCIVQYVTCKLQENITQIRCPVPKCSGLLEHDQCRVLLPKDVFNKWGNALCQAALLANSVSINVYCPYEDCSAPLLVDDEEEINMITESKCPSCKRLFCVKCRAPWHAEITCEEFQENERKIDSDSRMVQLAKDNKWMKCSNCRFIIERSQGCLFMKCRCGHTFCYNCGAPSKNHYCTNCNR